MRVFVIILTVMACIVAPASAATTITDTPVQSHPYSTWIARSKMPTPTLPVRVYERHCPGKPVNTSCAAYYLIGGQIIRGEIWLSPLAGRFTFYHELGHIALGTSERTAEAYAACAYWGTHPNWRKDRVVATGYVGYTTTRAKQARICPKLASKVRAAVT
jgi:hypothetical protein